MPVLSILIAKELALGQESQSQSNTNLFLKTAYVKGWAWDYRDLCCKYKYWCMIDTSVNDTSEVDAKQLRLTLRSYCWF